MGPPLFMFTTIYRLMVMVGTLVVGWMAWQAYGPPVEKLRPVWNRAVDVVREALDRAELGEPEHESEVAGVSGLEPMDEDDPLLEPLPPEVLQADSDVRPIASWEETPRELAAQQPPPLEEATSHSSVAGVVQRLREMGVADYSLSPWGTSGDFYRFRCAAPWGNEGSFQRHFEAVASDPTDAARRVLSQVESWHHAQASASAGSAQPGHATSDVQIR